MMTSAPASRNTPITGPTTRRVNPGRQRCLALLAAAFFTLVLVGCGQKDLSEAPTRQAAAGRFASQPSTISAVANIPLAKLTELLNAQVPTSFEAGGNGEDVCIDLLLGKACAGTKYEIKVIRSSMVVSGAGPQTLRVTMPITFSGKGGLRGDGARLLNVDAKNFDGALLARVDFAVSIDDGWCPKLDAKIGYDWTSNPRVEIAGGVNVDVTGAIEPRINEKLPELIAAAKGAIDCRKFKSEIGKLYASRTFPVDVPRVGVMHLNVMPLGMGLSAVQVLPDAVKFAAVIRANVDLSTQPLTPQALPLPAPDAVDVNVAPQLRLAILLRLPYETLAAALKGAAGTHPFLTQTPAGQVSVSIRDVEVYPSRDRIAIGLSVDATLPTSFLDTKGKLYATGVPVVEERTRIAFPDATFTSSLDSRFWGAASSVFEGPLRQALRRSAFYDFGPDISRAKQGFSDAMRTASLGPGMTIAADNIDMRLGRIAVAERELMVEGLLGARLTISTPP